MKDHRGKALLIQMWTKILKILMEDILHYSFKLNQTLISTTKLLFYGNYKSNYRQLWKQGEEKGRGSLDI